VVDRRWQVGLDSRCFQPRADLGCRVHRGGPPPRSTNTRAGTNHEAFDLRRENYEGWWKWNRNYWLEGWPGFLEFWFSKCFTEPDSESEIRHFFEMGMETSPEVIAATVDGWGLSAQDARSLAGAMGCPTLVIHGDGDEIAPLQRGRELARLAPKAGLVVLPGSGHEPQCRIPEIVNPMLDGFPERHPGLDSPIG
jgi:pimeloyl-ACP methyl ester carboxylesterase